jgi:RimJ/RimL family protein N-acetyltransferase
VLQTLFPIETHRLRLRPYEPDDLDEFVAIHAHPNVVRYLYSSWRTSSSTRVAHGSSAVTTAGRDECRLVLP